MNADIDERAIFVSGPVVVFKWRNAEGWPVEYVSPNASEVFGYDPAAFQSGAVPYASILLEEDAARVAEEVTTASAGVVTWFVHEPYRIRHRDGRVRWLYDFTHVLRDERGTATHFLGYVIDITARREAEEQALELERRLLHAQKLESLGVLAGGVAHDFNNLLTGILGQASLARRRLREDDGALEAVEQIERLARSAADLTQQLLAYSGRGSFVVTSLDMSTLVGEIVEMLGVSVPRNATLEIELGHDLPLVEADRAQLQQIAMNLLTNAGEALGGGQGRVVLRTYVEECNADRLREVYDQVEGRPGLYVVLEVTDTGAGMDVAVVSRLFDPFFTTKGAGRGLGMSAVQGIVRGHGGLLSVRSTPGLGSTFKVLLPARAPTRSSRPDREEVAGPGGSGTILVVDDQASIRFTLRALLVDLGYQALVASEGGEALRLLERHAGEVVGVLLDLTMPGMSGPETLEAIRKLYPRLPVVLTSGFSEKDSTVARHATAFLQKPYGEDELARVLASALSR